MIKKIAITGTTLFIVAVLLSFFFVRHYMNQPLLIENSQLVKIKAGTSVNSFSKELVNKGWLENRFWLRVYVRFNPEMTALKKGTYQITPEDNLLTFFKKIVDGKEYQFSITFIEGTTLQEWFLLLAEHPHIKQTLTGNKLEMLVKGLSLKHKNPEGLFFPETYLFSDQTSDLSILKQAFDKMAKDIAIQWQQRALSLPYDSPYQALIMASIIEKESAKVEEQPNISSVFVNRLNKKMRLQTDPTVIYGLGSRYKGNIKRTHLREKTAYNTYRINGLPPTPIAMPGLSAINAALNPAQTDYLYFVSQGNGYHYFSKNLAEHNQAVKKYILKK